MKTRNHPRSTSVGVMVVLLAGALLLLVGTLAQAATLGPTQNVSRDATDSLQPKVAQDPDGNAHVVWVDDNGGQRSVRYAKGTWNGSGYTFGASVKLADAGSNQYALPAVAVAPNGTIMALWSDASNVLRSQSWNARDAQPSGAVGTLGNGIQPTIAADSASRFHIAWSGDFQIQYCEWSGASCSKRDAFGDSVNRPDIAVDSSDNVHVVWDTGQATKYRARPAGGNFGAEQDVGGGNFAQIAGDGQGNVHIVRSSNFNVVYCRRTLSSGCTDERTIDVGDDLQPTIGATKSGTVVVGFRESSKDPRAVYVVTREGGTWTTPKAVGTDITPPDVSAQLYTDRASLVWSNDYEIQHGTILLGQVAPPPTAVPPTPTPPVLNAKLTINDGAAYTNQPNVSVKIDNLSTTPATTYSLADGTQPAAPSSPFSNPSLTTAFSLNTADGRCRTHTVWGKLGTSAGAAAAFSGSIIFDPSAQAEAFALNPNSTYNHPINGFANTLVPTGAVEYTRVERFTAFLMPPQEECSGLRRYAIVSRGAPAPARTDAVWKPVTADGYVSALVMFSARAGQGPYQFDVYVEDNAGNITAAPYTVQIVYDTEGPSVSGSTSDLAVTSSPKGGVATITLGARTVADNLYTGGDAGQSYWGYSVAVKPTAAGAPSATEWDAYGAIVQGRLEATLQWNMARGLVGKFQPETNYTVYIRYLDGAGNASDALSSQPVLVRQLEFFGNLPLTQR